MKLQSRQIIGRWLFVLVLLQMLNISLGYDHFYNAGKSGYRHKVDLKSNDIIEDTFELVEDTMDFIAENIFGEKTEETKKSNEPRLLENIELCCYNDHTLPFIADLNFNETEANFAYKEHLSNSPSELNSPPPKQQA